MTNVFCSNCHGRVPESRLRAAAPGENRSPGPWGGYYVARQVDCPACGARVFHVDNRSRPEASLSWSMAGGTMLREGRDYDVVWQRRRCRQPTGSKPLHVAWLYHPFTNEVKHSEWVRGLVLAQPQWSDENNCRIGVLPRALQSHLEVFSAEKAFDQIWVLDERCLVGAAGPYPSPRADLSLFHTFGRLNLQGLWHYWPSALIPSQFYTPFMSPTEMAKTWALYAREYVEIKVKQETR